MKNHASIAVGFAVIACGFGSSGVEAQTTMPANAAELYLKAGQAIKTDCPASSTLEYRDFPPFGKAWDDLAAKSWQQNGETRRLAHTARDITTADWSISRRNDEGDILNQCRQVADVLGDAALYQHFQRDDTGALETLLDLDHLADLLCHQVTLRARIAPLVGLGVDELLVSRLQMIVAECKIRATGSGRGSISVPVARAWIARLLSDRMSPDQIVKDLTENGRVTLKDHFRGRTGNGRVIEAVNRDNADRAMAAMSIACHLYRFDHRRWPTLLDDLAPAYLPTIPIDPWGDSKQTLGYVLIKSGLPDGSDRPMVYHRSAEHDGLFYRTDQPTYSYYNPTRFPPNNQLKYGGQFRDVAAWVPKANGNSVPTTQPLP